MASNVIEEFLVAIGVKYDNAAVDQALNKAGQSVTALANRIAGANGGRGRQAASAAHQIAGKISGGGALAATIEASVAGGPVGAMLGAIAAGAMAVGVAVSGMAAGVARAMEQIGFKAQVGATSVAALKGLEYGFTQIGLGADTAAKLAVSLAQAIRYNPGTVGLLNSLGVQTRTAAGGLRDMSKVTDDLLDRLARMDPVNGGAFADLFGIDRGLLDQWRLHGREAEAEADWFDRQTRRFGVDQDKLAQESHDFMVQWRRDLADVGLLFDKFAQDSLPSLTNALRTADTFLTEHAGQIKDTMTGATTAIVTIGSHLTNTADTIDGLVNATIGWKKVLEAAAVVISARILGPLGPLLLLFDNLVNKQLPADFTDKIQRQDQFWEGSPAQQLWHSFQQWLTPSNPNAPNGVPPTGPTFGPQMVHPGSYTVPLGIRNNNPGNLRSGAGQIGTNSGFAVFQRAYDGLAAMGQQLERYGRQGYDTIASIVNRWAPPSDNNPNNGAYMATIAKILGVDVNTHLNLDDPNVLSGLMLGITKFENGGNPYDVGLIGRAATAVTGQTVNHNTQHNQVEIRVDGSGDPNQTAVAVGQKQAQVNQNMTRWFKGAVLG